MDKEGDFVIMVGANIKRLRLLAGITQFDLACKCGLEKQNISKIEKGRANLTLKTLYRIAEGLGVSPKELLG